MAAKPKITVNFFERDLGMSHVLREAAKLRKKPYVKAGVTQKRGSKLRPDGKKTTAEIAQFHEYGAPDANIPERSFIRSTQSKNQKKYDDHIAQLRDKVFDPAQKMTTERALGIIGQEFAKDVKATIRAGIEPPLTEETIRRKNASVIAKAEATLSGLEAKFNQRAYRDALKNGGRGRGSYTAAELKRENAASEIVTTGGDSTPLIDTGQMINALSYEVVLEGSAESGKDGE